MRSRGLIHRRAWSGLLMGSGAIVGAALMWAALEAPFYNWHQVVAPIETQPLRIRQDTKGDGRYLAPRSGGRRHRGVDLVAPLGSPVKAIRSGRVLEVGTHRGLGLFVELEHRGALTSLYAHLATTNVRAGQRIAQGAVIGTVGKTGNARHRWIEPHVHLEVAQRGEPIDPATLGLEFVVASAVPEGTDGRGGE